MLRWYIEESGHPAFKDVELPENLPEPTCTEDTPNENNTDDEIDPVVESKHDGARFYFPSAHEPNQTVGAHGTQDDFIRAMIAGYHPGQEMCRCDERA